MSLDLIISRENNEVFCESVWDPVNLLLTIFTKIKTQTTGTNICSILTIPPLYSVNCCYVTKLDFFFVFSEPINLSYNLKVRD